jgi:hypothetical protein
VSRRICVECGDDAAWFMEGKELCTRHRVERYTPLSMVHHRDVPEWARAVFTSTTMLNNLAVLWRITMPHVTTHVFHRSEAHTVAWANEWVLKHNPELKQHAPPYYQRGWSSYACREIVLLVDETETPESLAWIFYHELAHIAVDHVPYLAGVFNQEDREAGRTVYEIGDDHAHEAHSIEQFCNRVATSYAGACYDRLWWRRRADAAQAEEKAIRMRERVEAAVA